MTAARRTACATAVLAVATLAALQGAVPASAGSTTVTTTTRTVQPVDDAFSDALYPQRTTGDLDKLVAAAASTGDEKTTFLRFAVPAAPVGSTYASASLTATADRTTGAALRVHPVASATWSQGALSQATSPAIGAVARTATVSAADRTATFDVTALLAPGATRSLALSASSGTAAFASRESGTPGITLTVTYRSSTVTPPPVTQPGTAFGVSIDPEPGESAAQAVARLRRQFGSLPVVRVYSRGLMPKRWDENATLRALGSGSDVVYSFKGDMHDLAAGRYDARLREFLASRPAGVKVWVALHHEPEDDVERGRFTPAQYRAATAHVAPVIRAAGGIPTSILMQWTLSPASGRDWHDYYSPAVDVLAWDAYNTEWDARVPSYKSAVEIVAPVQAVAKETGKAFGWAELGSDCIATDPTCAGRAAWLTSLVTGFSGAHAAFATYWDRHDFGDGADFSLDDAASIRAWSLGFRR